MSRLLSANFTRLFKSWVFRFALVVMTILSIMQNVSQRIDITKYPDLYEHYKSLPDGVKLISSDQFLFVGGIYAIFVAAVVIASFIGTEYSNGTMRNKLMVGHKRGTVYLANFITCTAAIFIINAVYMAVNFIFGRLILPDTYMTLSQFIPLALMQLLAFTSLSAILVFIAMLVHSKSASAVMALLLAMFMMMAVLFIEDQLREPEFYGEDGGTYIMGTGFDEETGEIEFVDMSGQPNPRYVGGTKRKVIQAVNDAMPIGQCINIVGEQSEKIPIMSAYSLGNIVVFTGAGLLLFRKKNLK